MDLDILAAPLFELDALHVIPGEGLLAFGPPVETRLGFLLSGPTAAADLSGDGAADLAHAGESSLALLLSRRDGGFEAPARMPIGSGPRALVIADLDGNGDPDVATANLPLGGFEGSISVLLNDGRGGLAVPRNFAAGSGTAAHIAALDIDGDLDMDLVVAKGFDLGRSILTALLNDGRGRFSRAESLPIGPDISRTQFLKAGDIDGDGRGDVLAAHGAGLVVCHGKEDGSLEEVLTFSSTSFTFLDAVLLDLDGGGGLDIAAMTRYCSGDAELSAAEFFRRGDERTSYQKGVTVGPAPGSSIEAVDADGDGSLDLAFLGKRDVTFFLEGPLVVVEDCDRDGILDECQSDCDGDGLPDACEIRAGEADCDGSGVPDACESSD